MADIHGSPGAEPQMPSAPNAGPAPLPYQGADQSPEPPGYGPPVTGWDAPGVEVMNGIAAGNGVQESSYAHDMNAGLVTPYYGGDISPIAMSGSGTEASDPVSSTIAGAVDARDAFIQAYQDDIVPEGTTYGYQMPMPPNTMDPAVGVQGTEGSYYDPPRDY